MSAVAWTHWDEAFELAGKCSSSEPGGDKRITFTLTPPLFERALVSLAMEHGWLPKSDPRYQEACRTGRLEWWDGRGRCVVLVREGSWAHTNAARFEAMQRAVEAEVPPMPVATERDVMAAVVRSVTRSDASPSVDDSHRPAPDVDAFNVAAEKALKAAEDKAIAAELSKPPEGLVPTSGPDAAGLPMPPRGKGKKK